MARFRRKGRGRRGRNRRRGRVGRIVSRGGLRL